jgi:hypothetical protein
VYVTAVNDVAELQQRAEDGCYLSRNTPGTFERVRQSSMRRAAPCVEAQGQHFENFVQFVVETVICNVGISDL